MTDLDREELRKILMRHGIYSPTKGGFAAMAEVRDLATAKARREALEEAMNKIDDYFHAQGTENTVLRDRIRSLIDQPSAETKSAGAEVSSEPFKEGRGAAKVASASVPAEPFTAHLHRQRAFSLKTFGPGDRAKGVRDHIQKELTEVAAEPVGSRLPEWVDVILLAFDGAWRDGHEPEEIIAAVLEKQARNEAREWPDWRTQSSDAAIEHVKRHNIVQRGTCNPDDIVCSRCGADTTAALCEPCPAVSDGKMYKSASVSVPAEPDPYEDEWVTKVQEALDSLDLEPPDTEAWREVPVERPPWAEVLVDAQMLAEVFDAFCGADGYNLVAKIAIERADRAKLGEK